MCVVGSGAAGISAAIEAARLGRKVVLVESFPVLGGQAVNSIIGTFCGLYSNGTHGYQFTHGVADDILLELGQQDKALFYRHGPVTTVVYYDEVALSRWIERAVEREGIVPLLGATLFRAEREGRRITSLEVVTRYGNVIVEAQGFVDASGDAALAWLAGLDCRESDNTPVYGTQMIIVENVDERAHPTRPEMAARMKELGDQYGLVRKEAISFIIPGRGIAALNMTHTETPLEPLAMSKSTLAGREQADRAFQFLREQFHACFGQAKVRAYGMPGVRQTRWIAGRHQLTLDEVRRGHRHFDAIGRTAWPVELHDKSEGHLWQSFPPGHAHYIPLGSMISEDCDNLAAAGRCIDADLAALSSVRVMGPCMAMGAAAAHALDLAGAGSVHQIDVSALQKRVADNLDRTDAPWNVRDENTKQG
ncbi:MAG: FAD-dependent oxidoreductase [Alphaproteobacteria bacterium]|nr:FAD-dependent oxidoreductase [Alphaproteobacteria bacterium]